MRLVSYNIHACVGRDRHCRPGRIAQVLARLEPDVVALQEVDSRASRGGLDQAELIARELGMDLVEGPLLRERSGHYGNAILSRWPLRGVSEVRFQALGLEPRGWLEVEVRTATGSAWRVVTTHLDLLGHARSRQLAELAKALAARPGPLLLAGDLNEWRPWRRRLAGLPRSMELLPPRASFPARLPILALDRLAMKGATLRLGPFVDVSTAARLASDHLPLWAEFAAATPPPQASRSDVAR